MLVREAIIVAIIAVLFYHFLKEIVGYRNAFHQPIFAGYFHPSFRSVAETFRQNVQRGLDKGSAFAVYHNGEILIDLWGGWADESAERPWQENTVTLTWSVVKGAAAVVFAQLFDMGVLDYKEKVQHYWPEFVHENVTVEMLLSHQAGMSELNRTVSLYDVRDNWEEIESLLANATPVWPPGTAVGYHATTYGLYADALVRKVDPKHRNISRFFEEEIAQPLGIDYSIGLPQNWTFQLARQHFISPWTEWRHWFEAVRIFFDHYFYRCSFTLDFVNRLHTLNNVDLLTVGYASTTGFGTARGIAKLNDFLANNGSISGKKLLSQKAVSSLGEPLTSHLPDLYAADIPFSRGMKVFSSEGHGTFGHSGLGGNIAYADANNGLGVAYLTNYISLLVTKSPCFDALQRSLDNAFKKYIEEKARKQGQNAYPVR